MLLDRIVVLRNRTEDEQSTVQWYIQSRIIQGLESELRGERGCLRGGSRPQRSSRALRTVNKAHVVHHDGLDMLMGFSSLYQGRRQDHNGLMLMVPMAEGHDYISPSLRGYVMPALSIAGLSSQGVICAGYMQGDVPLRTASWGPDQYPQEISQVKRMMDGRCAWMLMDKDTDTYCALPGMVMLFVEALRQSKL